MSGFCPHCGYNLTRDEVIEANGFTLDPRGSVTFNGLPVSLTRGEANLLHALARARGRIVTAETLHARIALREGRNPQTVAVVISRIRKRVKPCPITTVRGAGYRWGVA